MKHLMHITMTVLLVAASACGDDDDGGSVDATVALPDASSAAIDANLSAPVASFTITPGCTSSSSTAITFTSTSTDPDQDTLTCAWSISSGNPATSTDCTVTGVTFPHLAFYQVTLTVDDGNGNTHSVTMPIGPC